MGRKTNEELYNMSHNAAMHTGICVSEDERIIQLHGEINESASAGIISQLFCLVKRDTNKPIHMIINSYGGSIDEMFAIYDAMKYCPTPIHTVGFGKIMSAGVLLLAAGVKDKRLIGKNARVMIHSTWGITAGNIFEAENEMKEWKRQQLQLEKCLAHETNKSLNEIKEIMKDRFNKFLSADEAIKFGIVDSIV